MVAGVPLDGGGTCRGCPIEDLEKIEAPKGATYFINYTGAPDIVIEKDGQIIAEKVACEDIAHAGFSLKVGERTAELMVAEDMAVVEVATVKDEKIAADADVVKE